ncbi:uncharacterized protein LOC143177350 [Calliopsis andreniformis]|uniref:uncharacterized protein LOC143177350 n=1 Tax=Calliopsis andreniformis TaxID=337506 RepID=UPI003FCCC8C0
MTKPSKKSLSSPDSQPLTVTIPLSSHRVKPDCPRSVFHSRPFPVEQEFSSSAAKCIPIHRGSISPRKNRGANPRACRRCAKTIPLVLCVFFPERFGVWQNVHVLDMNSVGNSTSTARIHFHIQSWYDQVEDFDSAEFGYVNFTSRGNLSYIPFASANISQIGCGRAIYTATAEDPTQLDRAIGGGFAASVAHTIPFGFGDRVETLVCNYGPLDRKTPGELYEDGVPGLCPRGTLRSERYGALCRKCFPVVFEARLSVCVRLPRNCRWHRGDGRYSPLLATRTS